MIPIWNYDVLPKTYAFEDWTSTVTQYAPPHGVRSAVFLSTEEIPILQKR